MNWSKDEGKQVTFFTAVADDISSSDALLEMWRFFATRVLPLNNEIGWDYCRIEFWSDSGRIVLFPASTEDEHRIEKAGCQVVLPELLQAYEDLADSDLDDDIFTVKAIAMVKEWAEYVIQAAYKVDLPTVEVSFWDADSERAFLTLPVINPRD